MTAVSVSIALCILYKYKMSEVMPHYVINPPNNAPNLPTNMKNIKCISSTGYRYQRFNQKRRYHTVSVSMCWIFFCINGERFVKWHIIWFNPYIWITNGWSTPKKAHHTSTANRRCNHKILKLNHVGDTSYYAPFITDLQ